MTDDLTPLAARVRVASSLAKHLASQIDDIRTTAPVGWSSGPTHDGTPRPTESIVEGLIQRGVTDAVIDARRLLSQAAELTERACHSLERARDNWESPTVS